MTEQEIENARADVDQLDIEQLRCGVLLQLLHIEALKAERDRLQYEVDAIPAIKEERDAALEQNTQLDKRCAKLEAERDAWVERHKACVKCLGEALQDTTDVSVERDALALGVDQWRVDFHELRLERDALAAAASLALNALEGSTEYFNIVRLGESRLKDSEVRGKCHEASTALRQAGVQ